MAHGIMENDNIMYVENEAPWHGLGVSVKEAQTSEQAIIAAGMNWEVVKVPTVTDDYEYTLSNGETVNFGGIKNTQKFDMIRSDTMENLGSVGSRYEPLQNVQAFDFFDSIVGSREAIFETAGSLMNGRKIWMLAKLPEFLRINSSNDIIEKYMLLATSHDGSMGVQVLLTPVRVVCHNTFTNALNNKSKYSFTVRHTPTMTSKINAARNALGFAQEYYTNLGDILNEFARYEVTENQVDKYIEDLFPINKARQDKADETEVEATAATRTIKNRETVKFLFENGKGNSEKGITGTAYSLLNGVTEYADWFQGTRVNSEEDNADAKLSSIWFGSAATLKSNAFQKTKELCGIN